MWNPDPYMEKLCGQVRPQFAFSGKENDWDGWRTALKAKFTALLGGFPGQAAELMPVLLERKSFPRYVRERVEITTYDGLRMPIYVLIPNDRTESLPTVIACHGHGYGSKEIVGLEPDGSERQGEPGIHHDFALQLVKRGYVVLAPELLGFGQRRLSEESDKPPKENSCYRISTQLLLYGQTMAGHRIYETMRAVDYAATRPDVNPERIGMMGISGGGLVAAFTAALDERVQAAVVSCYTNLFRDCIIPRRHCIDNYIPGILQAAEMPDLIGLIAPRPLLIEAGIHDKLFPIEAVQTAFSRLEEIYSAAGAGERLEHDYFDGGHEIGGRKSYDWFSRL